MVLTLEAVSSSFGLKGTPRMGPKEKIITTAFMMKKDKNRGTANQKATPKSLNKHSIFIFWSLVLDTSTKLLDTSSSEKFGSLGLFCWAWVASQKEFEWLRYLSDWSVWKDTFSSIFVEEPTCLALLARVSLVLLPTSNIICFLEKGILCPWNRPSSNWVLFSLTF